MHMIITYRDERRVEARVLALSAERMRVCLPNGDDALELRYAQGVWSSEDGEPIEIESIIAEADVSGLLSSRVAPQQATAGRAVL